MSHPPVPDANKASTGSSGRLHGFGFASLPWLVLAALIALVDQFSKIVLRGYLQPGEVANITPFVSITRVHNAPGTLAWLTDTSNWPYWYFVTIGFAVIALLVWLINRYSQQRYLAMALACLLGGSVSHLVDRMWHNHIIEILDVHWLNWHSPTFNLADGALALGLLLLTAHLYRQRLGPRRDILKS